MLSESELTMQREILSNETTTQNLQAEAVRAADQKRYLRELRALLDGLDGDNSTDEGAAREAAFEQHCLALQAHVRYPALDENLEGIGSLEFVGLRGWESGR
jgi:hypothetical protein